MAPANGPLKAARSTPSRIARLKPGLELCTNPVNTMPSTLNTVAALPASAFTGPSRRTVLSNLLGDAVALIDKGNLNAATDKLTSAIIRTDGCALRGAPDAQGQGQDYIANCANQALVYPLLRAALDYLQG